jgi:predicted PurR-regulated permease PerM
MMRFVPGLAGAVLAYIALLMIQWLDNGWIHATLFFAVYLFVAVGVDKAMSSYRRNPD